ncbi:Pectinesterase 2.1, partial [Mucuna pruriens]
MASQQSLLDKPRKSVSKTIWLILSVAVLSSSALIASYFIKPTSFFNLSSSYHVCRHALDTASCMAHVSEVAQAPVLTTTKDNEFNLLRSFLMKSTSHIERAMNTANTIKNRINSPRAEAALRDCVELMDMSMERIWDSMVALTKQTIESQEDAHTWLSTVLTNHETCLDGLEGPARSLMEAELQDLISRAGTSLALFVAALPPKVDNIIGENLNMDFPSWVTSKDRKLLESTAKDIKPNVVVATDGTGNYMTVAEAVESVPNKSNKRYIIYIKNGTYNEHVEISSQKKNVMLVGDGMNETIISGSLNRADGTGTFQTATVAAVGDGFIAQDIQFRNTAGSIKEQAVALRVGADQAIINRCKIAACQDTLYAHSNRQFYRDSFISGTVDFIFGNAAVVLQKCKLVARKPLSYQNNMVTAQGRTNPNQNTGTSIQQCNIIPATDLKPVMKSIKTYLGRPWQKYSRTVVMQSLLSNHIDPKGWSEWDDQHKDYLETLYYGEYSNRGPGAGLGGRVNWTGFHILTTADAMKFTVKQFIQGDVWLANKGVNYIESL